MTGVDAIRASPMKYVQALSQSIRARLPAEIPRETKGCDSADLEFKCPECPEVFSSYVLMCGHRAGKHQYLNPLRWHVKGVQCECCVKSFHSYPRLYKHVRSIQRCKDFYLSTVPAMPEEVARAIMAASTHMEKAKDTKSLSPPCVG